MDTFRIHKVNATKGKMLFLKATFAAKPNFRLAVEQFWCVFYFSPISLNDSVQNSPERSAILKHTHVLSINTFTHVQMRFVRC